MRAQGVTLGHFPQSFEYATIGGFAATRSAGQASSGYGRFDELVTSLRLTAPAGTLRTLETPHTAAGPVAARARPGLGGRARGDHARSPRGCARRPSGAATRRGWRPTSHRAPTSCARWRRRGALPDVVRLSDEAETRISLALSGTGGAKRALLGGYLRLRRRDRRLHRDLRLGGRGRGGGAPPVARRPGSCAPAGRRALGSAPGRAWERGRYDGPYLRDELMDLGYLARRSRRRTTWSEPAATSTTRFGRRSDPRSRPQGTHGLVMCHLSHAYPDGASLYFTFIAPRRRRARSSSSGARRRRRPREAIVEAGGTITHHHGVGRDHVPYMRAEVGELGHRRPARRQGPPRPGRDHEPGQAAAVRRRGIWVRPRPAYWRRHRIQKTHRGRSRWPTPK